MPRRGRRRGGVRLVIGAGRRFLSPEPASPTGYFERVLANSCSSEARMCSTLAEPTVGDGRKPHCFFSPATWYCTTTHGPNEPPDAVLIAVISEPAILSVPLLASYSSPSGFTVSRLPLPMGGIIIAPRPSFSVNNTCSYVCGSC